jgi:hypothetical protein
MKHKRLFANISASAIASLVYLLTRFFIPPFVLGHIGIEAFGLWGMAFNLVSYIGISAIGFSNAYVKYVAEYSASGEKDRANRLLSSGFTISTGVGVVGFAGLVALWPTIAEWMKVPVTMGPDAKFFVLMVTGTFFANLTLSVFRDALTGLQEIAVTQKVWVLSFMVENALIVGLILMGFGVRGLGVAFLIRTAIELGGAYWLASTRHPWLRIRLTVPDRASLRLIGSFGGICQINCLLAIVLASIDEAIAMRKIGLAGSGLIDLGKRFPGMATMVPFAFVSSVFPSAATIRPDEGEGKVREMYMGIARYMNLSSGILFGFLFFAAAPCLVFWLKNVPEGAALVLSIFAVATQVHMLTGPGTSILKAIGRPAMEFHYSLANIAALLAFVPLSRVIVGHWDVKGIAMAVAASTVVSACWFISQANRKLGVSFGHFFSQVIWPGLLPWAVSAACILPFAHWAAGGDRLRAALVMAPLGIFFVAASSAAVVMFAANAEEKASARNFLSKFIPLFKAPAATPGEAGAIL